MRRRQMEERHAAQRAQKKEFERERAAVDEIVRKIHEEDHEQLVRKKQKQEATKKYIREFMMDREKMRTAQRAAQHCGLPTRRGFGEEAHHPCNLRQQGRTVVHHRGHGQMDPLLGPCCTQEQPRRERPAEWGGAAELCCPIQEGSSRSGHGRRRGN